MSVPDTYGLAFKPVTPGPSPQMQTNPVKFCTFRASRLIEDAGEVVKLP